MAVSGERREQRKQDSVSAGSSTISSEDGRILVPKRIRNELDVEKGDEIAWFEVDFDLMVLNVEDTEGHLPAATSKIMDEDGAIILPNEIMEYLPAGKGDVLSWIGNNKQCTVYRMD